jgi:hypothetical protein
MDGTGVPQGARADDIALGARVISAVDSFLDLTKNPSNAFGRTFSKAEGLAHLRQNQGVLYDPEVVDWLERLQTGDLLRQRIAADGRSVLIVDPKPAEQAGLVEALARRGVLATTQDKLQGVTEALTGGAADMLVLGLGFGVADLASVTQSVRSQAAVAGAPVAILGEPGEAQGKALLAQVGASQLLSLTAGTEAVADAVAALYEDRVAHGGPGRPVQGSLDEIGFAELLRALGVGKKSGKLQVNVDGDPGILHLERGRAVYASYAGVMGGPALGQLCTVQEAEFVFDPEALLLELPHLDQDLLSVAQQLGAAEG